MSIRSIAYRKRGGVDIIDIDPPPDPPPGHVQIETLACGICAMDVHIFQHGCNGHVIPGHEGVARIAQLGRGVQNLRQGMRVTGHGLGFTERANVPANMLMPLPDDDRPPEHWIVEPVSCVVTGLDHCNARAGDRIAVVGCGFMGLMLIQGLSRMLLDRLIAIDPDPARLELARQFGADQTHNTGDDDLEQQIDALHRLEIDCVVDTSGTQGGLDLASRILRKGGRLNLFGWNHGRAQFPGDTWHMGGFTVVNSAPNARLREPFAPAIRLLNRGHIDLAPLVTHTAPLERYPALLETAAGRRDGYIKGVITWN